MTCKHSLEIPGLLLGCWILVSLEIPNNLLDTDDTDTEHSSENNRRSRP